MSGGMPELGSKISLISKADIRYEGRLFTVDPQECTIALANVRSFGTEDRETQYPIAPQSQIYDYILFRGSDIKDIRVVNNGMPHPNDPAIMQMQLPNGQHLMPHFPPVINTMGNYGNPFGNMGNISGGIGSTTGLAPGSFALNKPKQQSELNDVIPEPFSITAPPPVEHKDQDLLTGGSRSTTPVSLISRKSPTADMGVQVNQGTGNREMMQKRQNQNINQQQQQRTTGGIVGGPGGHQQRDRRDSGKMSNHQIQQHQQQQQQHDRNHQRNHNHMQNNQNRGWINRGNNNMRGGRGRGRSQNQHQGGYRQTGINMNKGHPKNTIEFEHDYDFEQANNQFEELRSQLSKLKVGDDAKTEQVNGETDKKDDSGNETGAGEHEQEEEEVVVGYDKTKSFFDNISCEAANDRSKGKNRTDWREERKLNCETFGISSARRGNYRGRGGYYNRNMNMHGGYRGYRGGNNYRGRSNNHRNAQQSTGIPVTNKAVTPQQQPQPQPQIQQQQQQQQPQTTQQQPQPQPQQPQQTAAAVATGI